MAKPASARDACPVAWADRLLETGWLTIVLFVPLAFNPWAQSAYAQPKAFILRSIAVTLGVIWACDRLLRPPAGSVGDRRDSTTISALVPAAAALLVVLSVATLLALDPALSFWGSHGRAQGLLTLAFLPLLALLVASRLRGAPAARRLYWVAGATLLPLTIYAVLQGVGPDPFGLTSDARSPIFATLGRSNFLAAYLALLLPLLLSLAVTARQRKEAGLALFLGLLALVLLVATRARAGWLAAAVALVCWVGLHRRRALRHLVRDGGVRALALVLMAVLVALGIWWSRDLSSGTARLTIWGGVQKLFTERPLLGFGPDSLELVFPSVYPPELVYFQGRGLGVDRAHNLLLDWGVTLGILGLVAGAVFLAVVLRSGCRCLVRAESDGESQLLVIGGLAALVGNLAGNLLSFDVLPTLTLTWLLAGVIVALGERRKVRPGSRQKAAALRLTLRRSLAALAFVLAGTAVLLLLVVPPLVADFLAGRARRLAAEGEWSAAIGVADDAVGWFAFEPNHLQYSSWLHLQLALRGEDGWREHLQKAERRLEEAVARRPSDFRLQAAAAELHGAVALRLDRRHLALAEEAWSEAIRLAPNHATLWAGRGRFWLQADRPGRAAPLLRKAVDLDATDADSWRLLGDLELRQGRPAAALPLYRLAAKHAPDRPEPLVGVARSFLLLGQPEPARRELARALSLAPRDPAARALWQEVVPGGEAPPGK